MRWLRKNLVLLMRACVLVYLFIPIAVIIVFSLQRPAGKSNIIWNGFTLDNWLNLCGARASARRSSRASRSGSRDRDGDHPRHADGVRARSPPLPRPLGEQPADLPADGDPRGRAGAGLRRCSSPRFPLGIWTIILAHVMFCLRFVVVTVRARLAGMDPPRTGGDGPLRQATADVPAGHLPARLPGHHGRGAAQLRAVLRRLHHHHLNAGTTTRSRCTSGVPPSAVCRCRSTSSARSCSWWPSRWFSRGSSSAVAGARLWRRCRRSPLTSCPAPSGRPPGATTGRSHTPIGPARRGIRWGRSCARGLRCQQHACRHWSHGPDVDGCRVRGLRSNPAVLQTGPRTSTCPRTAARRPWSDSLRSPGSRSPTWRTSTTARSSMPRCAPS